MSPEEAHAVLREMAADEPDPQRRAALWVAVHALHSAGGEDERP